MSTVATAADCRSLCVELDAVCGEAVVALVLVLIVADMTVVLLMFALVADFGLTVASFPADSLSVGD